jgi:hypothetical protein
LQPYAGGVWRVFLSAAGETELPDIYGSLKYETETGSYILNGSMLGYDFGTLLVKGPLPASGIDKSEAALALGYSVLFREYYSHIAGTA